MREKLWQLGEEIAACSAGCAGTYRCPEEGVLPRGLIYEQRDGDQGTIVLGMNPGSARDPEKAAIRQNRSYEALHEYWSAHLKDGSYYGPLRQLVHALGRTGPILWTDVAKCQSDPEQKGDLQQALRTCSQKFLTKEVREAPADWPVIAVGVVAYQAASYLFPHRAVIGVPHASGNWAQRLFRLVKADSAIHRVMCKQLEAGGAVARYYRST